MKPESPSIAANISAWVQYHGTSLLYGVAACFVVLLFLFQFTRSASDQAIADYFRLEKDFSQLAKEHNTQDIHEIARLLDSSPELISKFGPPFAQLLMIYGDQSKARPFVQQATVLLEEQKLPLYATFTQSSLDANIEQLEVLKGKLIEKGETESALFAYTLIELPFLYQLAGDKIKELTAWHTIDKWPVVEKLSSQLGPLTIYRKKRELVLK